MAVIRNRITVTPPPGETVTVDILEDDVSVGTAHAERTTSRTLTLPLVITARTNFFLPRDGGPYEVSVKLNGVEIAGPGGTTVTASSFPTEVNATVDVAELGDLEGSGGSIAVGEPYTPVTGDDGGDAASFPGNVPVFAFRYDGYDHDLFTVWADGNLYFGDGNAAPSVNVFFDYDDSQKLSIDGGDGLDVGGTLIVDTSSGVVSTVHTTVDDGTGASTVNKITVVQTLTLSGLPTEDPAVAGQVWNDAGTLKISAG